MEFRGREYNNWIDDAYLMMGKAQFYKREYLLSKRLFNFVISKYHRRDLIYDAMIWKARVDVIRGNYEQALNSLDQVKYYDKRGKVTREGQRLYPRVYAELYIQTENYERAIEWLDKSIDASRKKDVKLRMMFIKAQIYQKMEQDNKAIAVFKQVIKKNPSYELTFYSKINIAKSYDGKQDDDFNIQEELEDMLKDAKNKDYKDVIYYALAQIKFQEGKKQEGIELLQKSVSSSMNNNRQKAVSALELGEIFFETKEYQNSQAYYDTAMMVLPKNFPDYEELQQKHNVLSDLVTNLLTIEKQDSLQRIAKMGDNERRQFIQKLIKQIREDEIRKRQEEQRKMNAMAESRMNEFRNNQLGGGGEWYFYNQQSKSFGFTEFRKRWGERKLEDNWRLKNKGTAGFDDGFGGDAVSLNNDTANGKSQYTPKDVEYYLQDLPMTDSAMAISDSIIRTAMFNLGLIYQEGLNDYKKAVDAHENLIDRFPSSPYTLRTYFYLYQNHKKLGNETRSNEFKQLILNNYPDSDYAKIIQDPDYFKKQNKETNKAEDFYQEVFAAYQSGNYDNVKVLADTGMSRFSESDVAARLALLKAFAEGHISDSTAYMDALKFVVNNYAKTEPANKASEMIQALTPEKKKVTPADNQSGTDSESGEYYTYEPDEMQLYIAIFSVEGLSINRVKIAYSNFNSEYHGLKNLSVNSVYLDSRHQMLTVSRFDNAEEGLKYYRGVKNNAELQRFFKANKGQHFLVSVNDYSRFYKDKDVNKYLKFFVENYMNNQK
jgi:tetratricopeptide (TPR) repeat protein